MDSKSIKKIPLQNIPQLEKSFIMKLRGKIRSAEIMSSTVQK
jgi:hypothetical protein